jgi:peptide deformylase
MILPIVAYGDPVLKKEGKEVSRDQEGLKELIDNMFETMYAASGVGLAAPQIGRSLKLFIIDASPFEDEEEQLKNFKKVFINPVILDEDGEEWSFNEGCLSFPDLRLDVDRKDKLRIRYQNEAFETIEEEYDGLAARIIQHEYDHVYGVVFTDRISALRKRMVKGKLANISKGKIKAEYKMRVYTGNSYSYL